MEDRNLIHFSKALGTASVSQFGCGRVCSLLDCGLHNGRNEVFTVDILRVNEHSVAGIGENSENETLRNRRENWSVLGAERDDWSGQFGKRVGDMTSEAVTGGDIRSDSHCRDSKYAHRESSRYHSRYVAKEVLSR
jgi:hypothetical protein